MKIVIISRTCYPYKAPRSYRATELAKEFVRQGYNVSLYAFLGDYDYSDVAKETGIQFKNLGAPKFGMVGNTQSLSQSPMYRFLRFIGRPFYFPDCTMIPMVKDAIKKEGDIDLLITIAEPHVIHYAASLSDLSRIKTWVADCGDPFMHNPFNKKPFYFEPIERRWSQKCNYISVPVDDAKDAYYKDYRNKIVVIPQGYDFSVTRLAEYQPNIVPTFAYAGIFYKDKRDPSRFFDYLLTLDKPFKFVLFGGLNDFLNKYKEQLGDRIDIRQRIPRDELLYELSKMDFLINISNNSSVQQPSKLIDYALTQRPILSLSSLFPADEKNSVNEFLNGNYESRYMMSELDNYNIVNVAKKFVDLSLNKR